jgi:hypothetical protein
MMRLFVLAMAVVPAIPGNPGRAHAGASAETGSPVPVIDGGVGPCSLELTVTGDDSKPVNAANVKVHIAYGFMGVRRLDLEAYTNADGRVNFTGLPARVHQPPLEFRAAKDQAVGTAAYDPASECNGKHGIPLRRP